VRDAPSLEGVDAKIARAKHHLSELEDVLQIALDPRRDRFAFDSELETRGWTRLSVPGYPRQRRTGCSFPTGRRLGVDPLICHETAHPRGSS
jgi:hypothetical protein